MEACEIPIDPTEITSLVTLLDAVGGGRRIGRAANVSDGGCRRRLHGAKLDATVAEGSTPREVRRTVHAHSEVVDVSTLHVHAAAAAQRWCVRTVRRPRASWAGDGMVVMEVDGIRGASDHPAGSISVAGCFDFGHQAGWDGSGGAATLDDSLLSFAFAAARGAPTVAGEGLDGAWHRLAKAESTALVIKGLDRPAFVNGVDKPGDRAGLEGWDPRCCGGRRGGWRR